VDRTESAMLPKIEVNDSKNHRVRRERRTIGLVVSSRCVATHQGRRESALGASGEDLLRIAVQGATEGLRVVECRAHLQRHRGDETIANGLAGGRRTNKLTTSLCPTASKVREGHGDNELINVPSGSHK